MFIVHITLYPNTSMKLLENAKLDSISSALCMNTGDCTITGRWVVKQCVYMWSFGLCTCVLIVCAMILLVHAHEHKCPVSNTVIMWIPCHIYDSWSINTLVKVLPPGVCLFSQTILMQNSILICLFILHTSPIHSSLYLATVVVLSESSCEELWE